VAAVVAVDPITLKVRKELVDQVDLVVERQVDQDVYLEVVVIHLQQVHHKETTEVLLQGLVEQTLLAVAVVDLVESEQMLLELVTQVVMVETEL
jgi:hypothetical protein